MSMILKLLPVLLVLVTSWSHAYANGYKTNWKYWKNQYGSGSRAVATFPWGVEKWDTTTLNRGYYRQNQHLLRRDGSQRIATKWKWGNLKLKHIVSIDAQGKRSWEHVLTCKRGLERVISSEHDELRFRIPLGYSRDPSLMTLIDLATNRYKRPIRSQWINTDFVVEPGASLDQVLAQPAFTRFDQS